MSQDRLSLVPELSARIFIPAHRLDHHFDLLELVALNPLPSARRDSLRELESQVVRRLKYLISQPRLERLVAFYVRICFLSQEFHFDAGILNDPSQVRLPISLNAMRNGS